MTTLFENNSLPAVPAIDAQPPKKHSWLPLLTILFLISYGLMTMLIVEQGSTIESQRALIRELFRDSTELSAMKVKAQQEMAAANPTAQAPSHSKQNPSTDSPSAQVPAQQAPSSQAAPQRRAFNQTERRQKQLQPPSRPASDLADARRELKTI